MKKERIFSYILIAFLLGFSFFSLYYLNLNLTGLVIESQETQEEFDLGTYNNTEYNNSDVVLKYWTDSEQEFPDNNENDGYFDMAENILLLHMNDNWNDSSGNENHGTASGATFTSGKLNQAGEFDGTNDYVNLSSHSSILESVSVSSTWTISFWANAPDATDLDSFFQVGSNLAIMVGENDKGIRTLVDGNTQKGMGYLNWDLDWHHIVVVENNTDYPEVYIDGKKAEDISGTGIGSGNEMYAIGKSKWGYFNGKLDEFSFWNKTLTNSEIEEIYQRQKDKYGGGESGDYISKVFDSSSEVRWNNLTYSGNEPSIESLFCVVGGGDVYKSSDGISWSQIVDKYGRTSAADMFSNSEYLYIHSPTGNEVWRSSDGTDFEVIYNSFSNSPLVGNPDKFLTNNNLYIATSPGEVYKSTDNGETWILKGDANAGATNNPKGITLDTNGYVYVVDGSGSVFKSTNDGVNWTEVSEGYGGGSATNGLEADNNDNLYILLAKKVYKSADSGVTWTIINDSFTPYTNNGVKILITKNNKFYILDAVGRVFKSENSGVTWNEIGDCNNDDNSDPLGLTDFVKTTNLTFQVKNCSSSDCSDSDWQTLNLSNINLTSQYFQYKVEFLTNDSSITPSLNSVSLDYTILNSPPQVSISKPSEGTTYGYNSSLNLDFSVSDSDDNLDSCWYNLENENTTITNCQNITFNVSSNGDYLLTLYANDTEGELTQDNVSFSVQIGAPTITTTPESGTFLNTPQVILYYTPSDIDLDSCELYSDSSGSWEKTQIQTSPINNSENNFSLNLQDREYKWNVRCNDSQGNEAFNGNKTFTIDTTFPKLTLEQPTGTKSSRTITSEWQTTELNPNLCKYNVYRGDNIEVSNRSVSCSDNSSEFSVTIDADFTFNFYINDSAGNLNHSTLNFSVDTSSTSTDDGGSSSSGGGGSGGGGGSSSFSLIKSQEIGTILVDPGESKKISLEVENNWIKFLNDCKITGQGNYSSWISSSETKSLGGGEKYDFIINLNVPKNIAPGEYNLSARIKCQETEKTINFTAEIIEKKLSIELVSVKRKEDSAIQVNYTLAELSGFSQDVKIEIIFLQENKNISEKIEKITIEPDSKEAYSSILKIPEDLRGEFNLLINAKSDYASSFVQEDVVLGTTSPLGGFAIFLNEPSTDKFLSIFLIVAFVLFALVIVSKTIRRKRENLENN